MIRDRLATPVRVDQPVRGSIEGHRRFIDGNVWSYWVLGPVQWSFRTCGARTAAVNRKTSEMAAAMGHDVEEFIDFVPVDAAAWAADLDASTPDPLPDVPGCDETWATLINRGQDALSGNLLPIRIWGVNLGPAPKRRKAGDQLPADLLAAERTMDERFSGQGMNARKAHAREVAWIIHRATAPGHDAPHIPTQDRWGEEESRAFGDTRTWEPTPSGRVVKVSVDRDGTRVERFVAVLTMGLMEEETFPENGRVPWLAHALALHDAEGNRIPVRIAVKGRVMAGSEAKKQAEKWMRRARNIRKHYREHDEELPPTVDRTIEHAVAVYDEVTEQPPDIAARFHGVVRFYVAADSEQDAMAYARILEDHYAQGQHKWLVQPGGIGEPFAAARMLREFTPGVRPDIGGYHRELPLRWLAGGMSNMGTTVGTPTGFHLGWTVGDNPTPVLHDPWYPMRHNRPSDPNNNSGFFGIVANLGGGKSYLEGTLIEESVRAGVPTYVLDGSPGAPLSRICALPHIAPYAVHIALGDADAGLLNPYHLIADPVRLPEWDDAKWQGKLAETAGDRKELVVDTMMRLLPESSRRLEGMEDDMREAVRLAGGGHNTNPRDVIRHLASMRPGPAANLAEMADGIARLIFPPAIPTLVKGTPKRALLTVISTGDIEAPDPTSDRSEWTGRERASQLAVNLAAILVSRGVYAGRRTDPKNVFLDELRVFTEWRVGRMLFNKLTHDARKYFAGIYAACQSPGHLTVLGVGSVLGGMFLGRQVDDEAAMESMDLAGSPREDYEVLLHLGPGQFVYTDTFRRTELMRVKRAHPLLDAALDTSGAVDLAVAS